VDMRNFTSVNRRFYDVRRQFSLFPQYVDGYIPPDYPPLPATEKLTLLEAKKPSLQRLMTTYWHACEQQDWLTMLAFFPKIYDLFKQKPLIPAAFAEIIENEVGRYFAGKNPKQANRQKTQQAMNTQQKSLVSKELNAETTAQTRLTAKAWQGLAWVVWLYNQRVAMVEKQQVPQAAVFVKRSCHP